MWQINSSVAIMKPIVWTILVSLIYCIFWCTSCTGENVQVGMLETDPIINRPIPYALSATDLTYLAMKEQDVYNKLSNYANELQQRLTLIQRYMTDYEQSSLRIFEALPSETESWKKATTLASNTAIAYKMIRRFSKDYKKVEEHINKRLENDLLYELKSASGVHGFPSERDHVDAMEGLLRLHYFYDIDTQKFSDGNMQGMGTNAELSSQDALEIANYALYKGYFTLAMDWINAAEYKYKSVLVNDTSVTLPEIYELRERVITLHDRNWNTFDHESSRYMYSTKLKDCKNSTTVRNIRLESLFGDMQIHDDKENNHYRFISLCNGNNYQKPKDVLKLYCWYDTESNPYWAINPLKKELLHSSPPLVQIYDVIGNSWISYLTSRALPTLQRAPLSRATPRTATYAWLSDDDIEDIPLARRIELMTGLNVMGDEASEYLQIAAYAFGGHVSTHVDSLPENPYDTVIQEKGNRVATVLIYLNDVSKGGRTAFPLLGTSVIPVKGSAVFWYTSRRNGSIDRRMLHAACPVFGHKWIATKWTHLHRNFQNRPCSMNSSE